MVPRHTNNDETAADGTYSRDPYCSLGRAPKGVGSGTARYPKGRLDPQEARLTKMGSTYNVPHTFHWPQEHRASSGRGVHPARPDSRMPSHSATSRQNALTRLRSVVTGRSPISGSESAADEHHRATDQFSRYRGSP